MQPGKKMMFIDGSNPKRPDRIKPEHLLTEGAVYTIASTYYDETDGHHYYFVEERMHIKPVCSYRAYRFIPVQDDTADEQQEPCDAEISIGIAG
ncbi:hypothetical protein SAMN05444008_101354 [Cnuella takakiae]|uniref:Uncharacterized protein n=1 Tax=Cnuella takakiae TaxID=1302690 RepID=A0A1M4T7Z3_9BACT|nr:hypothetical protein [Cnuella takakiae]SHE40616.1 hypothetical protein SAMN05444008_101354 [Cnuella takakiae]